LERIAASAVFQGSDTLRRLLLYLGEASLDGRAEHLKEYTVGVEALGRSEDYDPRTDSSARMQAARLRRKIEDYYRSVGSRDALRVDFPKGSFRLTFGRGDGSASGGSPGAVRTWKGAAALLGFLCLALAAALAYYVDAARFAGHTGVEWTPELEAIWRPFLDERTPVVVSYGSPLFASVGGWVVRRSELNTWEEMEASGPFLELRRFLKDGSAAPNLDYVGAGDVQGAFRLARLLAARKRALNLKRGLALSWEDIKTNHLVFVGGGKNQQNLRDLLADREFAIGGAEIRNLRPRGSEPALFAQTVDPFTRRRLADHALITFLPGLERGRCILVLAATTTEGIWGAVEAVTNAKYAARLVQPLRLPSGGLPAAYQAVLKVTLRDAVPVDVAYVTHRSLAAP
jgi:hypothetical protein